MGGAARDYVLAVLTTAALSPPRASWRSMTRLRFGLAEPWCIASCRSTPARPGLSPASLCPVGVAYSRISYHRAPSRIPLNPAGPQPSPHRECASPVPLATPLGPTKSTPKNNTFSLVLSSVAGTRCAVCASRCGCCSGALAKSPRPVFFFLSASKSFRCF